MSEHDKNVHAVRTFADDLLKERGSTGSTNTDTRVEPPTATTPAPTPVPPPTTAQLVPPTPKTPTKSAADYLGKTRQATPPQASPTTSVPDHLGYRAAPVIPKTAVLGELEHVGRSEKTSILSDESNLTSGANDGVIIQDKKRDRFHLLPAVGKAVAGWAKDKQEEIAEAKQPVHTITKAEARLDTIKAAAKESKLVQQEDFATVAAKLRAQERKPVDTKIIVKEREAVPPPSWNYAADATDTGVIAEMIPTEPEQVVASTPIEPTLGQAATSQPDMLSVTQVPILEEEQRFVTTRRKRPLPTPVPLTQRRSTTRDPLTYTPRWDSEKDDATLAEDALRTESKLDIASARLAAAAATVPDELEIPEPTPRAVPVAPPVSLVTDQAAVTAGPVTIPKPSPEFSSQLRQAAHQETTVPSTNQSVAAATNSAGKLYAIFGGVLVIAGLIVGFGLVLSGQLRPSTGATATPVDALVTGETLTVSYDTFHDNFMRNLSTVQNEGSGLRTINFTTADGTPANLRQIMESLLPNAASVLLRNTKRITIGYTEGNVPFIVIAGENYDSLFGGLLASEPVLSRNLAPVFGVATPGTFVDTTIIDHPARILKNGQGAEVLFYVFLDDTIALITTSRTEAIAIAAALVR